MKPSLTQKDSYHHEDLRSALIAKGLKLLDEEGYESFSLRKVAKACNVSHTAPYRHFKNKDDLILAIAYEAMQKFGQSLQGAVDKYPNDPKSQLKEMGCAYIEFFALNPEYLRLIFLSDIDKRLRIGCGYTNDDDSDGLKNNNPNDNPFGVLYKAVESYMAKKKDDALSAPMDQNALILSCWGLVHGISILIARKEFVYDGDYLELVRKIIWNGSFLK